MRLGRDSGPRTDIHSPVYSSEPREPASSPCTPSMECSSTAPLLGYFAARPLLLRDRADDQFAARAGLEGRPRVRDRGPQQCLELGPVEVTGRVEADKARLLAGPEQDPARIRETRRGRSRD